MIFNAKYLSKTFFMAAFFAIGCTGSGMAGCGSSTSDTTAPIDSQLVGIYAVTSFQASPVDPNTGAPVPDSCDQLSAANPPGGFLAMYGYRPEAGSNDVWLAAAFCGTVEACRTTAAGAEEPVLGYSFIQGSDQAGWTGYALLKTVEAGDQCRSDVQVHDLQSSGQTITIGTDTVQVDYMPDVQGENATCKTLDAIGAITPDLPCQARLALEATREADL